MNTTNSLQTEIEHSLYPTLENFKDEYKANYYGYYYDKYPECSFLDYLETLKHVYTKEYLDRCVFINENKNKIPDWVIQDKSESSWFSTLENDKKLRDEWNEIVNFLNLEITIEITNYSKLHKYKNNHLIIKMVVLFLVSI